MLPGTEAESGVLASGVEVQEGIALLCRLGFPSLRRLSLSCYVSSSSSASKERTTFFSFLRRFPSFFAPGLSSACARVSASSSAAQTSTLPRTRAHTHHTQHTERTQHNTHKSQHTIKTQHNTHTTQHNKQTDKHSFLWMGDTSRRDNTCAQNTTPHRNTPVNAPRQGQGQGQGQGQVWSA